MKKRLISLTFVLLMFPLLVLSAAAKTVHVHDYANILTNQQEEQLSELAESIRMSYGIEVVVLTTPGLYGQEGADFADSFYENNHFGRDFILFYVDMGTRQWYISTFGIAQELLTDGYLAAIEKKVIPSLSDGNYFDSFQQFFKSLPRYLESDEETRINLFLSLIVGAALAGTVLLIMRSTMNTKTPQRGATNYEIENSYHLRMNQDLFLYSNIAKRPKPQNNSSSNGTHRSSGGRSHGGRGGKF